MTLGEAVFALKAFPLPFNFKPTGKRDLSVQRRDFMKGLMAASVSARAVLGQQQNPVAPSTPPPTPTAPGPVPWMRGLSEVRPDAIKQIVPDAVAETHAQFFTNTQLATLRRLSEILMPPLKGYPGALEAGTPEFLDFLIGVSPQDQQQMYQSGLDRLDSEAKRRFNKPFASVSAAEADQLIRPWLRTWMTDHPPTEPYERFINVAHSDIRTATVNSQAWSDAAKAMDKRTPDEGLFWFPVDPDMRREGPAACQPASKKRHA
jgi:hypothetical protein